MIYTHMLYSNNEACTVPTPIINVLDIFVRTIQLAFFITYASSFSANIRGIILTRPVTFICPKGISHRG